MSIKSYALSFILLYIFVFILSTLFAFSDLQTLNTNIVKNNLFSGKLELSGAIKKLVSNNNKLSESFSKLDEVHQQIDNPEHYSYWQTHRLFNSKILPGHIIEASVYTERGKNLGQLSKSSLPGIINTSDIKSYFIILDHKPALISISPIVDHDIPEKIIGYTAIKSKVLSELINIEQFNHIQTNSIKSLIADKKHIPINRFINYLDYKIKQSNDSKILAAQVHQVIFRNSIILILFALFFYYLMSHFL